jgi:hypothetical protein
MLAPGSEVLRPVTEILEEMASTRPFSENESPPVATDQEMTTGRESGWAYKRQLMQLELQYDAARRTGRGMEFYRGMLGTRLGRVLLYKMMLVNLEPDMLRQSADSRERAYNAAYTFFSERPEEERIRFATIYANGIAATRRRYFFITNINLNRADYNFRETPQEIEKEKMDAYRAYMADKGIIVSPTTRFPEAGWDKIDPKFLLIEQVTGFGRRTKFGMEQQNPPWRDSQEPPFYGMTEEDYNEVQAMIRSRPQRQRQPRQPMTPERLALRAEMWERRAEELESRGESSEGWTEWRDGQRVPLPSWREILEARRIRNQPFQSAVQNAVARYLESNPPGAGAAFGVLQPTRSISDSRNIRRDSEDALREMWNLRRKRVRDRMRREIAGDIIFPDRPWHRAAPPYATTIQRYARGMIARNTI